VCDNPAMRSDLLDAAVWAEVCALLQEPNRLLAEYQRRLEVAREPAGRDEVVVLETQLRRLRQGIGRLIDSYAEGFIAKSEFEPRVKRLKERVTVVERQLQQTQAVMAQRRDLHLVLGHLEDFAATVARKLDDLDWSARRAIVRALVKHVEVDYTHIRVVFRVGPGPVVLDSTTRMLQDREGRRTSLLDGRVVGGSPAHSSRYRIATVRSPIMVVRALAMIMWEQSPTWPRRRARARDAKVSAQ
jgi:site-specific DNA recombinase